MDSTNSVVIKDEGRLAELGYAQQLQRDWSFWHNFGVSFSIIVGFLYSCDGDMLMFTVT